MRHYIFLFLLVGMTTVSAKTINLYDQPNISSKVVGTVDSEAGIVPIFTQKTGDWIKVGDPRNGNTGWIQSSEFSTKGNQGFSFSEHVISNGTGPNSYLIRFGTPKTLSNDEMNEMFKKMQQRQQEMQKMMNEMFKDFGVHTMQPPFPVIQETKPTDTTSKKQ